MKKVVTTLFTLSLTIALVLSGCGGKNYAEPDANGNFIINGSFEDSDEFAPWIIFNEITEEVNLYTRETDARTGSHSLHFWSPGDVYFTAEQDINRLEDGEYVLTVFMQGEAPAQEIFLFAESGGKRFEVAGELSGYLNWNNASVNVTVSGGSIKVGLVVKTGSGGWGTFDDFTLVKK